MDTDIRGISQRIGLTLVLTCLMILAGVHYAIAEPKHLEQPTPTELSQNYDRYIGQETLVFGTVVERGDGWITLRVGSGTDAFEMRAVDIPRSVSVEPGGVIQVYGTIRDDREIVAIDVVVVNPGPSSFIYKYATSLLAVLLFVSAFFQHWTVDPATLQLVLKDDG